MDLLKITQDELGANLIATDTDRDGMLSVTVAPENLHGFMLYLRDMHGFNFLTSLCGVHYNEPQPEQLGAVYHLHNWTANVRMRVKCFVPKDTPNIPSMHDIWASANWQERETFDFYGINFTGHPNLTRILNVDEMDFFPLRKEYPLEEQTRNDKMDYMFGR
jgi:NADH-quinone oxidoreductase subunit C